MKTLEWTTIDKTDWARGPWDEEPDKKQWQDPETGLACLIVRGPLGALCGYVGVTKGHPWYGKGYGDAVPRSPQVDEMLNRPAGNMSPIALLTASRHGKDMVSMDVLFDVHGGLTFAGGCSKSDNPEEGVCHVSDEGEPDDVWWFGFDCSHLYDLTPSSQWMSLNSKDVYRDLAYVEGEVAKLAKSLAAFA